MAVYVFHDTYAGEYAVFDSEETLNAFFADYVKDFVVLTGYVPEKGSDYFISKTILNPDFEKWSNS